MVCTEKFHFCFTFQSLYLRIMFVFSVYSNLPSLCSFWFFNLLHGLFTIYTVLQLSTNIVAFSTLSIAFCFKYLKCIHNTHDVVSLCFVLIMFPILNINFIWSMKLQFRMNFLSFFITSKCATSHLSLVSHLNWSLYLNCRFRIFKHISFLFKYHRNLNCKSW